MINEYEERKEINKIKDDVFKWMEENPDEKGGVTFWPLAFMPSVRQPQILAVIQVLEKLGYIRRD